MVFLEVLNSSCIVNITCKNQVKLVPNPYRVCVGITTAQPLTLREEIWTGLDEDDEIKSGKNCFNKKTKTNGIHYCGYVWRAATVDGLALTKFEPRSEMSVCLYVHINYRVT